MILSCYVALVYRKISLKSSFFEKAMFPVSEEQRKERKKPWSPRLLGSTIWSCMRLSVRIKALCSRSLFIVPGHSRQKPSALCPGIFCLKAESFMPLDTITPGNASILSICTKSARYSWCNSIARKRQGKLNKFWTNIKRNKLKKAQQKPCKNMRGFLCLNLWLICNILALHQFVSRRSLGQSCPGKSTEGEHEQDKSNRKQEPGG